MEFKHDISKISCWCCKYYYSFSSRCLTRQNLPESERDYCPNMELGDNQDLAFIENFEKNK